MKQLFLNLLFVLFTIVVNSQNKLNYGLVLGADRLIGVNEKTHENFTFQSRTVPKIGFFIEKPKNEKLTYTAMFTFHSYFEGFSEKIIGFGFDDYPAYEETTGVYRYYDLNVGAKYNILHNLWVNGSVFLSYHNNTHNFKTTEVHSVEGYFSSTKKVGREDINGGISLGLGYELNPKNKIVIEPFANVTISGVNREKYRHTNYYYNTFTEHKYGRVYFTFGAKFKLNRNQK